MERNKENTHILALHFLTRGQIFESDSPQTYDLDGLIAIIASDIGVEFDKEDLQGLEYAELSQFITDALLEIYEEKISVFDATQRGEIERVLYLQVLDNGWREHLYQMDILKTGIGLRGYNQKDPLTEYKKESYNLFMELIERLKIQSARILQVVRFGEQTEAVKAKPAANGALNSPKAAPASAPQNTPATSPTAAPKPLSSPSSLPKQEVRPQSVAKPQGFGVKVKAKVAKNDPCPCNSGKKYRDCCGKMGPKRGVLVE